jgi:uncharacterized protein with PQ loop repeat
VPVAQQASPAPPQTVDIAASLVVVFELLPQAVAIKVINVAKRISVRMLGFLEKSQ